MRSNPGEGLGIALCGGIAPHPNPFPASGEREKQRFALINDASQYFTFANMRTPMPGSRTWSLL